VHAARARPVRHRPRRSRAGLTARAAPGPPPPIQDDAAAHACPAPDAEQGAIGASRTEAELRGHGHGDVVAEPDRRLHQPGQLGGERVGLPPLGQVAGIGQRPCLGIHSPRGAHADTRQGQGLQACLPGGLSERGVERLDDGGRAAFPGGGVPGTAEDCAALIRDDGLDFGTPEVQPSKKPALRHRSLLRPSPGWDACGRVTGSRQESGLLSRGSASREAHPTG
jgi:hypothetical protein